MPKTVSNLNLLPPLAAVPFYRNTVSQYSASVTAQPQPGATTGFPATVVVDREWSGIKVTWSTADLGFTLIKIVRKQRDYAYSVGDGLTVYEGASSVGEYIDATTVGSNTYYYTLFFRNAGEAWVTAYWTRVWQIALDVNDVPERLWSLLPTMYRGMDTSRDSSTDMNLLVERAIAPPFREIEDLIDFFPKLLDVDETPGPYLAALAKYVGLLPNYELTYIQQRAEIKAALETYKKKGRKSSIEGIATAIAGVDTAVAEWVQNILLMNSFSHTMLDLTDPAGWHTYKLPGNSIDSMLDFELEGEFNTISFGLFLYPGPGDEITQMVIRKLHRTVPKFTPVYSRMKLWVMDKFYQETGPVPIDEWYDGVDTYNRDTFQPDDLFITYDDSWETYTDEHYTAYPWPEETWWDDIT